MSREANAATASDCTGNRFVAGFVTHKRLRLLCEGLDAAEALMADGVITATNDEPDKAFSCLRRGALDAIRLKDEEGAFEEHFIPLTQRMSEGDIRMMWNYLVDYVKKRGRPLSKRPIMEAIAAYLELAVGTSWRPYLDELLARADMAPEFLEAFRAEVVIKPRELRERRPSPMPNSPRAHSLTRADHRKTHAAGEKRSSGHGFKSLMPPGYSTSSGSTSTGRRSEPADRKTSPQNRNAGKTTSSRPTEAKVESTTIESDPKKSVGLDNWWESPALEPLQPRPTPNMGAEDCWWLNPPILTTTTDLSSSAPLLHGSVTAASSSASQVISLGSVVQTNANAPSCSVSSAPEAKKLSASGVVLGPVGATNTAGISLPPPHTGKALSSSAPLVATAVLPKATMHGTASSGVPLTGSIVTTHERTPSEPDASQNFPFVPQSLLRSEGISISQSFPSAAPSSQQYVSPLRDQQTPSIGHPHHVQQKQQVPQQQQVRSHPPNVINGSHASAQAMSFSHPSSRQGNYPSVSMNPMMGAVTMNPMSSPHINNKTNPFADLGQWCEEEMDSFSPNDANTPSEKKKKKKKKKEKDDDLGDIPKLRAPRTTGATRSTISGESTSGADQSLWDDKSGVFSKFSH